MRPRGFSVGPFSVVTLVCVVLTAVAVLAASPRVGLGPRDDLTAIQAASCPPVGDDGKVSPRAGDAKVGGGKNTDWLMAKWHWDDLKGHDLTVEKWCINATPDFEPYFSLRVIQSEYKIVHGVNKDKKEHVVVLPGVPTPTPEPSPTPDMFAAGRVERPARWVGTSLRLLGLRARGLDRWPTQLLPSSEIVSYRRSRPTRSLYAIRMIEVGWLIKIGSVTMEILGIDVGKRDLHAVLLQGDRSASKSVANTPSGWAQLQTWLTNRKAHRVHACLEATGGWSENVAIALHEAGHVVSVVNPSRIRAFAQSELLRTKTDRIDAALIARFCRLHVPDPWMPPPPEIRTLQGLVRRYQSLVAMHADEENRLQAPIVALAVKESIRATLEHLDRELRRVDHEIEQLFKQYPPLSRQRDLLTSIPGIGDTSAARILGEMPNIAEFRDVKAVAAFAGLSPRHHESGSSCRSTRLAKAGNGNLRHALYWPAISAMRHNPILRRFADRLRARGKPNMTIIAAVMRKLLVLAYGVLKSGRRFDAAYAAS